MNPGMFDREAFGIERLEPARRREVICAYLDDELSPEAARHVTAWLDAHPEVLKEVEHDRRVWDLLDLYEDEPVPEGFGERVLARAGVRTRARAAGRRLRLPRPAVLVAVAAAVLAALGVALWMRGDGPGDERSEPVASATLDEVPAEYLEEVDLLLALSEDEFRAYLLADVGEPWEDDS